MEENKYMSYESQTVIIKESSERALEERLRADGFKRLGRFGLEKWNSINRSTIDLKGAEKTIMIQELIERIIPIVYSDLFVQDVKQPDILYIVYGKDIGKILKY